MALKDIGYIGRHLCVLILCFHAVLSDNVGWKAVFQENIEEFHDLPLKWEGTTPVPSYVTGTFVRNGPARIKFSNGRRAYSSWMDGWAKLHSFKFNGSKVLYSGKMLETPNYLASKKKGELTPQITLMPFADPSEEWSFFEKSEIAWKMATGTGYDNSNPALWRIGPADPKKGIYLAVTDNPVATQFDINTLDTIKVQYPPQFPPTTSGCAHWMREPGTDNSIMINSRIGLTGAHLEVRRYKPEHSYQQPEVITKFKPKKQGYFHSFSITENYVVLFVYPITIDATKFFSSSFHLFNAMTCDKTQATDIYVISLKTGEVTVRETDYMYSFHHANAYETKDEIVVDLAWNRYENLIEYMRLKNMMNPPAHWNTSESNMLTLQRYRIGLNATDVVLQEFEDKSPEDKFLNHFDFPIINEEYRGKPYCVVYGWSAYMYSRNVLVKKNLCNSSLSRTMYIENHYSGEMFFVANPAKKSEDDGILLATVFDGEKEKSYLLVLDAKTFKPINKAYLPVNIPWAFHGMYYPEAQLVK